MRRGWRDLAFFALGVTLTASLFTTLSPLTSITRSDPRRTKAPVPPSPPPPPPPPSTEKRCLVQADSRDLSNGKQRGIALSMLLAQRYAALHNYTYLIYSCTDKGYKPSALGRACLVEGCDRVFYLDTDAMLEVSDGDFGRSFDVIEHMVENYMSRRDKYTQNALVGAMDTVDTIRVNVRGAQGSYFSDVNTAWSPLAILLKSDQRALGLLLRRPFFSDLVDWESSVFSTDTSVWTRAKRGNRLVAHYPGAHRRHESSYIYDWMVSEGEQARLKLFSIQGYPKEHTRSCGAFSSIGKSQFQKSVSTKKVVPYSISLSTNQEEALRKHIDKFEAMFRRKNNRRFQYQLCEYDYQLYSCDDPKCKLKRPCASNKGLMGCACPISPTLAKKKQRAVQFKQKQKQQKGKALKPGKGIGFFQERKQKTNTLLQKTSDDKPGLVLSASEKAAKRSVLHLGNETRPKRAAKQVLKPRKYRGT